MARLDIAAITEASPMGTGRRVASGHIRRTAGPTQAYGGPGTSAEWIVEAPSVNGQIAPLADYTFPTGSAGAGDFNGAEVATTLGGALVGAGLDVANDAGVMLRNNAQVSTPGQPDAPDSAFNALYGSTAPAAPTS